MWTKIDPSVSSTGKSPASQESTSEEGPQVAHVH
jgi:hypothetical protein